MLRPEFLLFGRLVHKDSKQASGAVGGGYSRVQLKGQPALESQVQQRH